MKKFFAIILTLTFLGAAAVPTFAQGRACRRVSTRSQTYYGGAVRNGRVYDSRSYNNGYSSRAYNNGAYNSSSYYDYRNNNGSVWDRHRDKITVAGGAGAGALLGAIVGGRKGAAIGALAGAGGSALYTYKIRNRNQYRRY
ncbi:MAG: hypothetical protein M3R68_00910 [Acidobacteriota bacterium]|nr:hypothetical protein [Acidobacteriota bacterium]